MLICMFILFNYIETHYNRHVYCSYIDNNANIIQFTDFGGNIWEYSDNSEKYVLNSEYTLKMHTNGTTDYIYDDIIQKILTVD